MTQQHNAFDNVSSNVSDNTNNSPDNAPNLTEEQVDALYEYINAPTRYVEFIHTSMMNEPVEEEYILLNGVWRTIDSNSAFAATTFPKHEIHTPVYWS
jgi:hypothetical protein